jgi:hypothetical protein
MRKYLFEFEDLPWFPDIIRRSMVDYLSFFLRKTSFYQPIKPLIAECLEHSQQQRIIDLCSGGGGPMLQIAKQLQACTGKEVSIILTDKFPNTAAYKHIQNESNGTISYIEAPVDATNVPEHLQGVRTCFSAFHHFSPQVARAVLSDAVNRRAPIAVFDGGDKNLFTILGIIILHPIVFALCTPFFKPFRLSRIVFTYLLPLIPLCTVWDGVVSILRLYTPRDMKKLVSSLEANNYTWQVGTKRHKLGLRVSYLIGYPV